MLIIMMMATMMMIVMMTIINYDDDHYDGNGVSSPMVKVKQANVHQGSIGPAGWCRPPPSTIDVQCNEMC